jgi:hypothetical protein
MNTYKEKTEQLYVRENNEIKSLVGSFCSAYS